MVGRPHKYGFNTLEVGDSLTVEKTKTIRQAAHDYGKRHDMQFETETISDKETLVRRVR